MYDTSFSQNTRRKGKRTSVASTLHSTMLSEDMSMNSSLSIIDVDQMDLTSSTSLSPPRLSKFPTKTELPTSTKPSFTERSYESNINLTENSFDRYLPQQFPKAPIRSDNLDSSLDGKFITDTNLVEKMLDEDENTQSMDNMGSENQYTFDESVTTDFNCVTYDSFAQEEFKPGDVSECRDLADYQQHVDGVGEYLAKGCKDAKNVSLGMTDDITTSQFLSDNSSYINEDDAAKFLAPLPIQHNARLEESLNTTEVICPSRTNFSRYLQENPNPAAQSYNISNLAGDLTKLDLSKVGNMSHVRKLHNRIRQQCDNQHSPPDIRPAMDKTTAIINSSDLDVMFDNSLVLNYGVEDETLPCFDPNISFNSSITKLPPVLKIHSSIDGLDFITLVPVGKTASANIVMTNTHHQELDISFAFTSTSIETYSNTYDPLLPFSMEKQEMTIDPNTTASATLFFRPTSTGEFSALLKITEQQTQQDHVIRLNAKSGRVHLEMDICLKHAVKPPGFMEPAHQRHTDAFNTTMVLDPVTYLGELDTSLHFDLIICIKNIGNCEVTNAEIRLVFDNPAYEFLAIKGPTSIYLDAQASFTVKLRARSLKNITERKNVHADFLILSNKENLLTHRLSATIGKSKIKIPKEMHAVTFYKGDSKEISGIRNAGNAAVTINVKAPGDAWHITPDIFTLEPEGSRNIWVSYNPKESQFGIQTVSKLKLCVQPGGYESYIMLQAVPSKYCKDLEVVQHRKRPLNGTPTPVMVKPPTGQVQSASSRPSQLHGDKTWLIFEPCLIGSSVKLSTIVQNPLPDVINSTINIEGKDKGAFELGFDHGKQCIASHGKLTIPIIFKPESKGVKTACLTIRSSIFQGTKFTVPLVGWTSNVQVGTPVVYNPKQYTLTNVDKTNCYTCIIIHKANKENNDHEDVDFLITTIGRFSQKKITVDPEIIFCIDSKLRAIALQNAKEKQPLPNSKLERHILKRLPLEYTQHVKSVGPYNYVEFTREIFYQLFHDDTDFLQAESDVVTSILTSSSINLPASYAMERSVETAFMVYNITSTKSNRKEIKRLPVSECKENQMENFTPILENRNVKILKEANYESTPPSGLQKKREKRLSSSTPARKLPQQNYFSQK